jgi:hypothetical protein
MVLHCKDMAYDVTGTLANPKLLIETQEDPPFVVIKIPRSVPSIILFVLLGWINNDKAGISGITK